MKAKETTAERFHVVAEDKQDPGRWHIKAVVDSRKAAEKYLNILRDVSDRYSTFRIETVIAPVPKKAKTRT